ncbi:MAG: hypothetical protein FJ247_04125 [Nitrospira sp.]|nr:hypothetical protein [Nitrospira sp.]
MDGLYNQTFHHLDKAFKKLESAVPPPEKVPYGNAFVFRYKEKTIHQAMVQKLARVVSGLHAAQLLLENGFLQEQAAVQRMLDEFHQDILFLAYAVINNEQTELHAEYLNAFYKEEFDSPTAVESSQDRPMVPRRKIRAYVARVELEGNDPSTGVTLSRTLHSVYSGFVHGASPHIMDMVQGSPPRFRIHGMGGSSRQEEHRYDLYNPFFRAISSFAVVAKAFGDDELFQNLREYHLEFDKLAGRNNACRE